MANMQEALKILFKDKEAINRQICLFSVCGIMGLITGILALENRNLLEVTMLQKIIFGFFAVIYTLFFTGYEAIFLHTRELPDMTMNCFKIALKRGPFIVTLISIPYILSNLFLKTPHFAFGVCMTYIILSIPLTIIIAGFSYSYDNNNILQLFKKFKVKDYFSLFAKVLGLIIIAYALTICLVFSMFFVLGVIIAIIYKGDVASIGFVISSQQVIISKLSNIITAIILTYTLTIGSLVWDYELIKTSEREV